MPEPQPTDDDLDVPGADDEAPAAEAEATPAPAAPAARKTPEELRAEVEARRVATSARLDKAEPAARATSDDPTGRKARKAMGKATSDDPTGASAGRASTKPSVPKPSKRTGGLDAKAARTAAARSGNPKKAAEAAEGSRYTAPIPRSQIESPAWVGGLMFALLGLGMLFIFLTYVAWGGRPATLGIGLGLILGGILTATQLR
ncbi:MAG TPA: hypothetical protein VEW93_09210 [Acidimicrobiales bacterium]|nr:hypothetical protein [Acidimicrobiales bacterium]